MALKISIITPSYNQASYLEETILSVIDQKYPDLEYIIIDGGSKDGSVEVIKKYEKHLAYWISEKDTGQSEAINKGLKKASGDIVAWLNSDDLYCKDTLQKVADLFEKNKTIDVLYGDVINFDASGKELLVKNKFELKDFFSRVSIHQPAVFWRRSLHKEIGFLDENLYYCMDYDLWMSLFLNYKSLRADHVFARFRDHATSKTGSHPSGLYDEYRLIVSRFFNSVRGTKWKQKLNSSAVNYDAGEKHYTLKENYSEKLLSQLFVIYLQNCLEIEYSRGNFYRVNRLFLLNLPVLRYKRALFIFLKTNSLYIFFRRRN